MTWDEHVARARRWLAERTAAVVRDFALGTWERFDYDLDVGTLVFSDADRARVVADVVLAGTLSSETQTWLWGWANPWMPKGVTRGLAPVRALGAAQGFERLTEQKWPAGEAEGWEVATVAAEVLEAQVVYRAPTDTGAVFLLLFALRRVGA